MRKLEINEIKKIELNLLVEFDKLCKANNLYYVLCGGTLLGAIRHKGFIPWDDDIDVLMPRPDYEKLLHMSNSELSKFLPTYIKMISWKNKTSNYPFIKMVDSRTKISEKFYKSDKEAHIWMDIFPIDGNPENKKDLSELYFKSKRMRKILMLKYARLGEGKNLFKKCSKYILKPVLKIINTYSLCCKIDENAKCYDFNTSKYIGGVVWGYGPQESIEKESFLNPISVEFEGYFFNAPSNYDQYLKGLYNNYMELPPIEKRETHSFIAYIEED